VIPITIAIVYELEHGMTNTAEFIPLAPGTRRILGPLGAGEIGEVYSHKGPNLTRVLLFSRNRSGFSTSTKPSGQRHLTASALFIESPGVSTFESGTNPHEYRIMVSVALLTLASGLSPNR